jgi:type VI secretion system secreted protein Hcp
MRNSIRWVTALSAIAVTSAYLLVPVPGHEEAIPDALAAQVDYFLKLDGIDGESTDDRHKGQIEIESFSWGASNPSTLSGGGGGGAGKVQMQDIHFTKTIDKSSPKLFEAVATGKHIKKAVLMGRGPSGNEFLVLTLEDVLISSYSQAGNQGTLPVDSFSINFAKIEYKYVPQGAEGQQGTAVIATWDLKANKK